MPEFWGVSYSDWLTIGISLLALTVSVHQTRKSNKKAEKALRLSQGVTELSMRSLISEARHKLNSTALECRKLRIEHPDADLTKVQQIQKPYLEDLYNQYDTACRLYLDKKIDRKGFRAHYKSEIIQLVEKASTKEEYFNESNLRFPNIMKVYKRWGKSNEDSIH